MKRLTTDDEKSTVLNLNMFYAKNGEVWVRGGGPYPDFQDVTLVQWIRAAAQKHGLNLTAEDPENLGDEMYDALQDGDETVEGIVALLHAAAAQATEMRERLKPVEDILGDDYDLDRLCELVEADRDGRCVVFKFGIGSAVYRAWVRPDGKCPFVSEQLIDTVEDLVRAEKWSNAYATREAAEKVLEEREKDG